MPCYTGDLKGDLSLENYSYDGVVILLRFKRGGF